jgi:hypothetical protein
MDASRQVLWADLRNVRSVRPVHGSTGPRRRPSRRYGLIDRQVRPVLIAQEGSFGVSCGCLRDARRCLAGERRGTARRRSRGAASPVFVAARRAGPNLRDARNATILRSTRGVVRVRLWCGLEVRSLPLVRGLPEHAHALSCDLPVAAHASRHIVPRARYSVAAVLDGSHDGGGFEVLN